MKREVETQQIESQHPKLLHMVVFKVKVVIKKNALRIKINLTT